MSVSDMTREGQEALIATEAAEHRRRGIVSMRDLLADPVFNGYCEAIANRLAALGARDPVDTLRIAWGDSDAVSIVWRR